MEIYIDNRSGTPIYDQIYSQIKQQILSGELQADEALPSIRGMAKSLRISVITTKRAYEELEKEGFIYTVGGKGSYVAPRSNELVREETLRRLEQSLGEAVRIASECGISRDEVFELLGLMYEDD
ncbi:MAG TPA: GntR family transcriptional regulator [Candidatus Monoglobus merdigallinarum]|uniref:GntR family transcriptional regulator n=1 Tax=Candidatus Monoglobus merdigallinarum TaxID=2838698 RepID=A0A9D1PPZ5_9FIRM|nr:GntR family transcriptional regulator [Candidatus Monoglobus merdigallinarum]